MFGQVWEPWGQGRVVVGAGTGNDGHESKTFNLGDSDGKYQHQLSISQLPSHEHKFTGDKIEGTIGAILFDKQQTITVKSGPFSGTYKNNWNKSGTGTSLSDNYDIKFSATPSGTIDSTGDDGYHNNIQPYAVANRWQRIA